MEEREKERESGLEEERDRVSGLEEGRKIVGKYRGGVLCSSAAGNWVGKWDT